MDKLSKSCLLFTLNWLDAQLTVLWIRLGVATEGNALMARVLQHGDLAFIGAKLLIGAFAAVILYRCAHLTIAKRGLNFVLGIYVILMLVHVATVLGETFAHIHHTVPWLIYALAAGLPVVRQLVVPDG